MRRALVVYESIWGNTRQVAGAVAEGLRSGFEVETFEVGSAPDDVGCYDLIVIGGPTHAFSMSRGDTRKNAIKQNDGESISTGRGIRDYLKDAEAHKSPAAAFDTRIQKPTWLVGSAARAAHKRLRRNGFLPVAPAESFFVEGTEGPLLEGELERAREWGSGLASG